LGRPVKKTVRIAIPNRLPRIAAPALFGVAAAVALSAQVTASPSLVGAVAHHAASAVHQPRATGARLLSAIRPTAQPATAHKPAASLPTRYTVRQGDSLSVIARHFYRNSDAWPVLYWANRSEIRWADNIDAGQVLKIPVKPARIPAAPGQLGPSTAPVPAAATAQASAGQAGTGQAVPVGYSAPVQAPSAYTGSSSFQQCVIARESGGSTQVMNSSGHYGLYQFSASAWAAYGGNPADFGNASTAEQNQVFDNAIAAGGQSNWSAYDGC